MRGLDTVQYDNNMSVLSSDVSKIIGELKYGKVSGSDNICVEYDKLSILMSLCFSTCLCHGYLPPHMIETTIVPIVKNKCGNLSDSNNYRPIALATIMSKVFESA